MRRLLTLWWMLNVPCREATHLFSESLDRKLTRAEGWALRLHLLYCFACRRYRRQIVLITKALRRTGPDRCDINHPPASPELSPEARERIKKRLHET